MKWGIIGVVVFIAAYLASLLLYVTSGMSHPHQVTESESDTDGTTVTVDLEDIRSNNSVLVGNVTITPGPALLDPATHKLKEDLDVDVSSVVTPSKRAWSKGTLPDVFPVSLILSGDVGDWPFDHYRTKPIAIELDRGPAAVPQRATVTFVDRLLGWQVGATEVGKGEMPPPYRLDFSRTSSTVAFGVVIVGVYLSLAGLGLFVAVQTVRNRRKFQPPMTTWYAAMLFAVMPLRTALPDSPPFGSWIDVTIVLWVIVVLVISMVLYISCWWRHLRPGPDELASVSSGGP
ncbi:hypothetical protein AWC05_00910 [Mycobacterium florentinum]|uniref:DUF4436 domain-containing protein n=1 Tax=Mycobacterium florentinum TaxID=292462 RepID=A0A1X1TYP5_MYCFL|nr:DUF4436 domain-containing protein [Mycobacterium florentinum]MCV7409203.1 DUF4436 domain-containing protein [Mycobacterium florentinum]ORV49711.1 hypothetical protein AWC05_00910 [Mycobacterium florentinum]